MQQHKFDSYESAITYLKERGTLTYWGWEGQSNGYHIYTFIAHTGIKYHCDVYPSGLIRVREF